MNQSDKTFEMSDWLAYRGRYVSVSFMLKKEEAEYLIRIHKGRVVDINPGPHVMPRWTFALAASADDWGRFWSSPPQPRFHDLMAMVKFKTLRVEGDQAIFMCNLLYFKELVSDLGRTINAS